MHGCVAVHMLCVCGSCAVNSARSTSGHFARGVSMQRKDHCALIVRSTAALFNMVQRSIQEIHGTAHCARIPKRDVKPRETKCDFGLRLALRISGHGRRGDRLLVLALPHKAQRHNQAIVYTICACHPCTGVMVIVSVLFQC